MTLSVLIKKGGLSGVATAIPATAATDEGEKAGTVARIATVAVANPQSAKADDRERAPHMAANRPAPIPHPEPIPADDPIISVDAWYPTFHQMHVAVVAESPDFDYGELKRQNLELYSEIKAAEARIDALEDVRLSEVMVIMTEWRGLILKATFEK